MLIDPNGCRVEGVGVGLAFISVNSDEPIIISVSFDKSARPVLAPIECLIIRGALISENDIQKSRLFGSGEGVGGGGGGGGWGGE